MPLRTRAEGGQVEPVLLGRHALIHIAFLQSVSSIDDGFTC